MSASDRLDKLHNLPPTNLGSMSHDISKKMASSTSELEAQRPELGQVTDKEARYDRSGAIDAETIEHDMTVMQAVKAYPAASWWAFVMSSTIVSFRPKVNDGSSDATIRSWSHTASS